MRIDPTAWTAMAIARCLASRESGHWTPARLAAETGVGDGRVRDVLTRLELARLIAWSPEAGGYVLSRPVATISVADVVTAATAEPAPNGSDTTSNASVALTAAVWPSLVAALQSVSLQEALPPADDPIQARTSRPETSRAVH